MKLADVPPDEIDVPASEVRAVHAVDNSRFISRLTSAFSNEQARAYIDQVRDEYPDASHHVPAYILGGGRTKTEYCSDDGEPSGTAGKPVLTVLRGSGLGNAILVVTRYFGGTLLGRGGLVKAYTESARLAVQSVARASKTPFYKIELVVPYSRLEQIRSMAASHKGKVESEEFAETVRMMLLIPTQGYLPFSAALQELSAGKLDPKIVSSLELLLPLNGGR
jgi:uncharacterized YigZ family protein